MSEPITFSQAHRAGQVVEVSCQCGRTVRYMACDLAYKLGRQRTVRSFRLNCSCGKATTIRLIERASLPEHDEIMRLEQDAKGRIGWGKVGAGWVSTHTIQDKMDHRAGLHAFCGAGGPDPCHHSFKLDLATLAAVLGTEFPVMAATLNPLLTCPKCSGQMSIRTIF